MRLGSGSERTVLECDCKEKMIIIGREDDWRPRNPVFRCECGKKLTLANKYDGGGEELLEPASL